MDSDKKGKFDSGRKRKSGWMIILARERIKFSQEKT